MFRAPRVTMESRGGIVTITGLWLDGTVPVAKWRTGILRATPPRSLADFLNQPASARGARWIGRADGFASLTVGEPPRIGEDGRAQTQADDIAAGSVRSGRQSW